MKNIVKKQHENDVETQKNLTEDIEQKKVTLEETKNTNEGTKNKIQTHMNCEKDLSVKLKSQREENAQLLSKSNKLRNAGLELQHTFDRKVQNRTMEEANMKHKKESTKIQCEQEKKSIEQFKLQNEKRSHLQKLTHQKLQGVEQNERGALEEVNLLIGVNTKLSEEIDAFSKEIASVKEIINGNSVKMAVFQSRKVEMMEQIGEKEKFLNGLRKEVHDHMQSTAILKQAQDMIPDMAEYDQASEEVSAVFTRFQKEDFEVNIKTSLRSFYTHIFQEQEAMNEESQTLDTIIKEKDEFLQNAASLQIF